MSKNLRRAAQYIRMSTDRQDLSPLIQKEAIRAFATANGIEIVSSYEDEGKSGVRLSNRPRLRQLLRDVAEGAPFSEILVFYVSRWGRFQDADAAAYHEYHCRMHGVQVIYVGESFDNDQKPTTVLLKSMRRVMAAEYSRDIACKSRAGQQRVVSMGFHMGALPPLGYRRCSVSADGTRRTLLEHGQLKAALTDRIQWVLGPEPEVALVRRVCLAYAGGLALEEIAALLRAEGWLTEKRREVSTQSLRILLKHEALIGNFVWGVKSMGGKIIKCAPSRMDGSVPRIVDDSTWSCIQARLGTTATARHNGEAASTAPLNRVQRRPIQLQLGFHQEQAVASYRRVLGSPQQLRDHTRNFGRALQQALIDVGLPAAFDTRTNVLTFWSARLRIRLMWPCAANTWLLERSRSVQEVQHVLVARMSSLFRPRDFFVLPSRVKRAELDGPLHEDIPGDLLAYWCNSSAELIARLTTIATALEDPSSCGDLAHTGKTVPRGPGKNRSARVR